MNKYLLSKTEKEILNMLNQSKYTVGMFNGFIQDELNVALDRLNNYGLIDTTLSHSGIAGAEITDKGSVYLKENPTLENPVSDDELRRLQKDQFEYIKRIRIQEDIIRYWKLASIFVSILTIIGWLLFFFK